jgi:hypothetical protein
MTSRTITGFCSSLLLTVAAHSGASAQYDAPTSPAVATPALQSTYSDAITFEVQRSPGIVKAGCVPEAKGTIHVTSEGPVEVMEVELSGLPHDTDFDFFIIQLPNAPFGLSWYQGDVESDEYGNAHAKFIGRFNAETFIVAPGVGPAPVVHSELDAKENPATQPVHTFHIGLWFNSPKDAAAAGCPDATTPFNGEHNAGVQVLNTANFPDLAGPLSQLEP